jgi:hypothetical protein
MAEEDRESFNSELDRLAETRRAALFEDTVPPRVLYHYTTAEGLLGIMTTGSFHATDSRYLNDTSEVTYAAKMVRDVVEDQAGRSSGPTKTMLERIVHCGVDDLESFVGRYVACLCEDGDLLSQWRGYGAEGGGFSIGIETRFARWHDCSHPDPLYHLRRVEYEPERQRQAIIDAVHWVCTVFETMVERYGALDRESCILPLCCAKFRSQVFEMLSCFKDPGYREENEWRLLAILDLHRSGALVKYRARSGMVVPYIEIGVSDVAGIHAGRMPVAEVVCGPMTHPELAQRSVRLLLDNSGYPWTTTAVRRSKIPFAAYG